MKYFKIVGCEPSLDPPERHLGVCYTCKCCGSDILEGEDYWDFRSVGLGVICASCIEDAHYYDAELEVV